MSRDLESDLNVLRTILTHAQNREFERAAALAQQTLASGFEHPLLYNVIATQLEIDGKYEDALRLLQRAVSISPGDVGARNALSLCLQRLGRAAEALVHVDELLKKQPNLGFAHANKGNALIALGALGSAKLSHLRAVELEPQNLAAIAALGSIATHRGEHQEARRWAAQALSLAPGYPDAVLSLAAAELAAGAFEQAKSLLHPLILDSRAGPSDRARATGLLGDVLDAQGNYAEAFGAYTTCNDALRQIHRRYASEPGMLAYTRALTGAIGATPEGAWQTPPTASSNAPDSLGHVFLLGFPRSGTTLLEVVLDGHPQIASIEEHELLTEAVLRFLREPLDLHSLLLADESQLSELRASYWERVRSAGVDTRGKLFLDKHPLNTLKLPLIARLFPHAKILFAYRDPRDVVLSCFRRRFKMNPAMYELLTLNGAAAFYDAVMEFADRVRPGLNLPWREVCYERLVEDLPQQTREICEFLELEWAAGMDDFAARVRAREHSTPSTAQLARGLDRSAIDAWKNYREPLNPILPLLARWVDRFDYAG